MFTLPSSLLFANLPDVPPGSIAIGERGRDVVWITGNAEAKRVTYLYSAHSDLQWLSMAVDENFDWRGAVLRDVRLEVDPLSFGDASISTPGCLLAKEGALCLNAVHRGRGFSDQLWVTIADAAGVAGRVFYAKWRLVVGDGDQATTLVEVDSGKIAYPGLGLPDAA